VGIGPQHPPGIGQAHLGEEFPGPVQGLGLAQPLVQHEGLGGLEAHAQHGVERGHGLLEDHADAGAAHPAKFLGRHGQKVAPLEERAPARDAPGAGRQAQDGEREHRLAAARFAHQAQAFAALQGEAHPVHGLGRAFGGVEGHAEAVECEQGVHVFFLEGRASGP